MTNASWLEMPTVRAGMPDNRARPKYAVETSALLVYQGEKVYVRFPIGTARPPALDESDCRWLTDKEGRAFEESLPFPVSASFEHQHGGKGPVGLGDIVAWLTGKAGIEECAACGRRKTYLNRITVWGWWRS